MLTSEWIDRSVRLPKERGRYLVYDPDYPETIRVCRFGTSQGFDNGRDKIARKVGRSGITHWMPLPAPPGPASSAGAVREDCVQCEGYGRVHGCLTGNKYDCEACGGTGSRLVQRQGVGNTGESE